MKTSIKICFVALVAIGLFVLGTALAQATKGKPVMPGQLSEKRFITGFRLDSETSLQAGRLWSGLSSSREAWSSEYRVFIIDPVLNRERCKAYGINSQGQVVGKAYNYDVNADEELNRQAFIWNIAGDYKILPPLSEGGESGVWGINDSGQVSGYAYTVEGYRHGVRWDNTNGTVEDIVLVDMGTLTNVDTGMSGDESSAFEINDMGRVVGHADIPNDDGSFTPFHGFIYDDTNGIQDLGTLTTHAPQWQNGYSIAYDMNDNQSAVGIASDSNWAYLPFIYDEVNGMSALAIDPTYSGSAYEWYAVAINDSGLIAGHVIAAANRSLPYYWEDSSSDPIAVPMPEGFPYGEIYGINEAGEMVGIMWDSDQEDPVEHAFIFDSENGVRDLNSLINPETGRVLIFARDINDAGEISGACDVGGVRKGFLLVPACAGDFDGDGDIDGTELAALASDNGLVELSAFAANFGKTDCLN